MLNNEQVIDGVCVSPEKFKYDMDEAKRKGIRGGIIFSIYIFVFAVLVGCLSGCSESKQFRADIVNIQQCTQNALGTWAVLAPNLEAVTPDIQPDITDYLAAHGEGLQRLSNAAANYSQSTQQKTLSDESRKMLTDYCQTSDRRAEIFNLNRKHLKSKNGNDNAAQMEAHSRNLYALAAAFHKLNDDLNPKKEVKQ